MERIDRPDGWSSLSAYLVDLKAALERLHNLRTHPVGQSLRQGTQTGQSLRHSQDPAIQAFFQAIDGPIRAHVAELGKGKDPLRARSLGGYAIKGIWSVRLRPGGGHHVDHIHQEGWLSSACYIDLPPAISPWRPAAGCARDRRCPARTAGWPRRCAPMRRAVRAASSPHAAAASRCSMSTA